MKNLLKITIFSYMSIFATQSIIGGFVFGGDRNITLLLVLIALSLLNVFVLPILSILSLPHKGPGSIFLIFILNLIVIFMMTSFIPSFSVQETVVSQLIIFGFVLPSKSLTKIWSLVFSALLFTVILSFFRWLSSNK
jgi:uncharacterized membrane protein YvlD (DUF360 family)